jgi:hypothetical protein
MERQLFYVNEADNEPLKVHSSVTGDDITDGVLSVLARKKNLPLSTIKKLGSEGKITFDELWDAIDDFSLDGVRDIGPGYTVDAPSSAALEWSYRPLNPNPYGMGTRY